MMRAILKYFLILLNVTLFAEISSQFHNTLAQVVVFICVAFVGQSLQVLLENLLADKRAHWIARV